LPNPCHYQNYDAALKEVCGSRSSPPRVGFPLLPTSTTCPGCAGLLLVRAVGLSGDTTPCRMDVMTPAILHGVVSSGHPTRGCIPRGYTSDSPRQIETEPSLINPPGATLSFSRSWDTESTPSGSSPVGDTSSTAPRRPSPLAQAVSRVPHESVESILHSKWKVPPGLGSRV